MKNIIAATKIYRGKDNYCRRGCAGAYALAGTKAFNKRAQEMCALLAKGAHAEDGREYINISLPNNKALTAYFD